MTTNEALKKAVSGKTREIAKRLGLSSSLVTKWQEPTNDDAIMDDESGTRNPLDRVEFIMEWCLSLGVEEKNALAPLFYLCQRFGYSCIKLPKANATEKGVLRQLSRVLQEFSDIPGVAGRALEDGKIFPNEAREIKDEAHELIREIMDFCKKVEEAANNEG